MFPKFQKPRLPKMGEFAEKSDITNVRHPSMPEGANVSYPGGRADYPGKFQKPRMGKPHKRF